MQITNEFEVDILKVIIAGGGTAGHINPGLAIAKYIRQKQREPQILFIGTRRGLETKLVPKEGFDLELINVRGFKRKLSFGNLLTLKELLQGILQARRIFKKFKPDVVIGTGGYVCGPVVFVASRMGIPTLIHEQNVFPGITNKILSRFANVTAISFKESETYFTGAKRIVYTGNPVRSEILLADKQTARSRLNMNSQKPLVIVVGGSLGAEKINETVCLMILKYFREESFNLIFATGNSQFEKMKKMLSGFANESVNIVPYIYDAANVYASADLMVCRAGAITCSELAVLGLPSIMVPSPNVVANHQEYNARSLEKQGASVVILEKDLNEDLLYKQITGLLKDREQLSKMSKNAKRMGTVNATDKIYSLILGIMGKSDGPKA
jgi:UDP-N-acetylglucosamine--N-acetylmuramyl-(pentapeptide) pyrophosphoryl-undecaprenol N-acetylglucosamine transferase